MAAEIYVGASSKQIVVQTILRAFDPSHKKHVAARRVLHYMLSLAITRGYRQHDAFTHYFRGEKTLQSPQLTDRFISQFLEFVSPDEFAEFVGRIRY
jgi:hypothetical protein